MVQADTVLPSLAAVATLAAAVNVVELLCTAGLPAVYTAVLSQQNLGAPAYYAYLALYILGYIADDSLMVTTAVIALGHRKLTETTGRRLKLLSGAVMLVLGAVLRATGLADLILPRGSRLRHERHLVIWHTDFAEAGVSGSCARSRASLA